ncbi:aminotransferase class I/II-fold pyridoxal phosphate-dependent enzyme [Massilia horti]|uniref:Pyridoxal phosphate-dependent aminotransferase family protein n=1 Tax=Massilia horti TaxID=2562153 RepID=A0A4Y9T9I6_9BURK|nr:pyridoxal phosphate-dependent aminotransferase family protein [Massilia horti]TFW34665.1 pyridoxal phosphate-dependent aminotransferase family protein [Massilia horti]
MISQAQDPVERDESADAQQEWEREIDAMLDAGALDGNAAQFAQPRGADLMRRIDALESWHAARSSHGVWQYSRALDGAPHPIASIRDEAGAAARGVNFASQDYLSLASHPAILEAAERALHDAGPHSAGSAVLLGNTEYSLRLERALASLLATSHITLFPTGWGAAFGAITALVQPGDHIVIDQFAHASLRQGASASRANVVVNRHLDVAHVRELLGAIRSRDSDNGILVVTEGLFSMDSDSPDLPALQVLCHEYGATLLVDVAHDLGALGPGGSGAIGNQGMLGKIDIVMGAFSKTFSSNGGFVATASRSVKRHLQLFAGPHMFSNALSPVQAAVILECIGIIQSNEGDDLRADLLRNVTLMRELLAGQGLHCMGEPSAIVPVLIGDEQVSRLVGKLLFRQSVFVNQVEFPGVPLGASRLRLQLMANHNSQQVKRGAQVIGEAVARAQDALAAAQARHPTRKAQQFGTR